MFIQHALFSRQGSATYLCCREAVQRWWGWMAVVQRAGLRHQKPECGFGSAKRNTSVKVRELSWFRLKWL